MTCCSTLPSARQVSAEKLNIACKIVICMLHIIVCLLLVWGIRGLLGQILVHLQCTSTRYLYTAGVQVSGTCTLQVYKYWDVVHTLEIFVRQNKHEQTRKNTVVILVRLSSEIGVSVQTGKLVLTVLQILVNSGKPVLYLQVQTTQTLQQPVRVLVRVGKV